MAGEVFARWSRWNGRGITAATERRVNHTGTINWASEQLFVSSSLAGWLVGLKPVEHQQLEVWFAQLLLGWIDPKTASF